MRLKLVSLAVALVALATAAPVLADSGGTGGAHHHGLTENLR